MQIKNINLCSWNAFIVSNEHQLTTRYYDACPIDAWTMARLEQPGRSNNGDAQTWGCWELTFESITFVKIKLRQ